MEVKPKIMSLNKDVKWNQEKLNKFYLLLCFT